MSEIYLTKDGYEKMKAELAKLTREKNALSVEINEAREQGDLKENAGYIYGKEKQAQVMQRISELELKLRSAKIVECTAVDCDQVRCASSAAAIAASSSASVMVS